MTDTLVATPDPDDSGQDFSALLASALVDNAADRYGRMQQVAVLHPYYCPRCDVRWLDTTEPCFICGWYGRLVSAN